MSTPPTPKGGRVGRIVRAPLLHFALIGGLLFLAESSGREPTPKRVIHISASEISNIRSEWRLQTGRSPTQRELALLIEGRVDDALLLQQAFALGWHRNDAIVQRRLIKNQRFLSSNDEASPEDLLRRAYEQGMDRSDIVVRRRLLERMKLAIASAAHEPGPSEAELSDYLTRHADQFRRAARVRLTHVYLSQDLRGERLRSDAEELGSRLGREHIAPDDARRLSDPFLLSNELPLWTEAALAQRLGPEFARAAVRAERGRWQGPVHSSYGLHFIWPHEKREQRLPPLDIIRAEVSAALLREREQRALRQHLQALRSEARIDIDSLARTIREGS